MRKLFSLLTAILFAGSMFAAEVTITASNSGWTTTAGAQTGTVEGVTVAVTNGMTGKTNDEGETMRIYKDATLTISAESNITGIVFTCTANGTTKYGPGCFNAQDGYSYEASGKTGTWTGSAKSVTFTAGGAQVRATQIVVTLEGGSTPPVEMTDAEKLEAYIALLGDVKTYVSQFAGLEVGAEDFVSQVDQLILFGNQALSSGDATTISTAVSTAEGLISSKINDLLTTGKDGLVKQLDNLLDNAQGCEACVNIVNSLKQTVEGIAWDSNKSNEENLANLVNQTEQILKDAQEGIEKALNPSSDPTNCAEAREAALSVSANNELYNDGKEYTIEGYVTEITYAWKNKSMSFWMADTKNGGNVIQAYKCAVENEADAPAVGDKVKVTGKLTKFNTTPEFAANCTVVIVERAGGGDTPAVTDPTNCAEAAAAALSVSGNNVPYNDSTIYTIKGYVTSIQTAYNPSYGNISFWMADTKDGGNVIEPYRCVPESAEQIPAVGDLVEVKGALSKYKSNPQFMAGCTCRILEKDIPATNLGEKTIAEFLALKNIKDTCVLTGIVANIKKNDDGSYNKYGNFDLVELGNDEVSVYIYGLLTADGQAQKFAEMGVDESDTLVIKAIYSEHNGTPQAANAIFVEVRKAAASGNNVQIYVNDASWNNEEGIWNIVGYTDDYAITLANLTAVEEVDGTYTVADLDPENSYIMDSELNEITLESGSIEVYTEDGSVYVEGTVVGSDGVTYELYLAYENVQPTGVEVTIKAEGDNVVYADNVASQGWWIIQGRNADYTVQLSNYYSIEQAAGTYDNADLDPDYSWVAYNNDTIAFASGSITLAEDRGAIILTGSLLGQDGTLYILNFMYGEPVDPTGVEVTIKAEGNNVAYRDAVASSGWWILSGHNDTYSVQLSNLSTSIEQAAGTYTAAELDPDYSWVAYNNDTIAFASGAITLEEYPRGVMVTGSLLAKDGVTYNLELIYGDTTDVDPSLGERINVTMTSGLQWQDNTAVVGQRWWYLTGQNEAYYIALSNADSAYTAAGTYTWEQMDKTYSYIVDMSDTTQIAFYSGTIEVAVDEFGKVTVTGELVAVDNNTYVLNLQYVDPKPETTVEILDQDAAFVDYTGVINLFSFSGCTADSTVGVQLVIDAQTVAGTYTEQDFDNQWAEYFGYSCILLKNAAGAWESVNIYSATITIVDGGNGAYTLTADLLCYNNTLYKVTLSVPETDPYKYDEASDFTATFSTYTVDESRLATMGSVYVIGQNEQGQVIMMDVILSGTATGLEPGTYSIDNTEEVQTVYAGLYDAQEGLVPSYAGMVEGQNLTNVWYLVSGTVNVDENLNIVVNALNSKGNAITVALTAPEPTGLEETVAAGKAAKILRNGQIYILKGDKIFNIMGAAIR